MEANKIRILDFLGASKRTFNIPVYQRNYDWKEENCERLFRDIEKIALSNFELEHFLGTVVYVVSHTQPNFTEYVLIDGQQRITSLSLLLYALYEAIEDQDLREDIYETFIVNKRAPEPLRIKLKPIESDMQAYEEILSNQKSNNEGNIYNNYFLFKRLIKESTVSPKELYLAFNNIELVYIQLEKDKKSENPQMIFESLNSTGVSLTPADLIRNFLLMNHSYDEQTKLYKEYWLKIEKNLNNSKISDFVRDYLTMKTAKITAKDRVYETFKEFAINPRNNFNEEDLLQDLLTYSKYYSAFLYFNSTNQAVNQCLKQFRALKSTTVYPFLMYAFHTCYYKSLFYEDELVRVMKVLISYIYRRIVCGYRTNAFNKIFAALANEVENNTKPTYTERVLFVLARKTSDGRFPRNKEFETEFIQKDMYKSKLDKYTLCMLESYCSKEQVQISPDITVEHIMPQKLTPQWQIALGKHFEEVHTQFLHTIGNLTISAYNSQLSNRDYKEKRDIYRDSNIFISRDIYNYTTWNEETIKKRAKYLFQIALKIWSLPEEYNLQRENVSLIDYTSVYNITTDINVTGEKPKQLIIADIEYNVSSWKEFLRKICNELFSLDSSVMYNLVRHRDFCGRARYIINDNSTDMVSPYKISDSLFIETNLSALDILNYCKIICEHYDMSDEVSFILNKNK